MSDGDHNLSGAEGRALDAIMAIAFRAGGLTKPFTQEEVVEILTHPPALGEDDKKVLEAMGDDYVDRLLETYIKAPKRALEVPIADEQAHIIETQKKIIRFERGHKEALLDALDELVTVAAMRGDDELPSPCNDPLLHTARMQTAWVEARDAIAEAQGGKHVDTFEGG